MNMETPITAPTLHLDGEIEDDGFVTIHVFDGREARGPVIDGMHIPCLAGMKLQVRPLGRLNALAAEIHADNVAAGWWHDLETGAPLERNVGELLMLVVSEIAEAVEGIDGKLMDDKLPHRMMLEVELADAKIRLLDIAGAYRLDLDGATVDLKGHSWFAPQKTETLKLFDVVREVARAMEGHRQNGDDRFIAGRKAFEVGIAAAILTIDRIGERASHLDIDAAMAEKRAFNKNRADHKPENRRKTGGKKY